MASDLNQIVVSGRLTRDPELKVLQPSGTEVAEFGIAVNRSRKVEEEWVDEASFFEVSVYGNRGTVVANKARKGDRVTVAGSLQQRKWEAEDGGKREKVSIVGNLVEGEFVFRKADGSDTPDRASTGDGADEGSGTPPATDDDIPF